MNLLLIFICLFVYLFLSCYDALIFNEMKILLCYINTCSIPIILKIFVWLICRQLFSLISNRKNDNQQKLMYHIIE